MAPKKSSKSKAKSLGHPAENLASFLISARDSNRRPAAASPDGDGPTALEIILGKPCSPTVEYLRPWVFYSINARSFHLLPRPSIVNLSPAQLANELAYLGTTLRSRADSVSRKYEERWYVSTSGSHPPGIPCGSVYANIVPFLEKSYASVYLNHVRSAAERINAMAADLKVGTADSILVLFSFHN